MYNHSCCFYDVGQFQIFTLLCIKCRRELSHATADIRIYPHNVVRTDWACTLRGKEYKSYRIYNPTHDKQKEWYCYVFTEKKKTTQTIIFSIDSYYHHYYATSTYWTMCLSISNIHDQSTTCTRIIQCHWTPTPAIRLVKASTAIVATIIQRRLQKLISQIRRRSQTNKNNFKLSSKPCHIS